jgi:ATP-dependent helicase/nuclease subunit B
VRSELKLPTWSERVREMEEHLSALIASCGTAVVTWQRMLGGEENLLSPLVERLAAIHLQAYGSELRADAPAARLAAAEVRAPGPTISTGATRKPAPSAPAALLPARISASGYSSLLACPYQFHARYVLGLAELDDVQELIEKKDYGSLVHRVLAQFHTAHPRVSALDPAAAARELEELSEREFADAVARNSTGSASGRAPAGRGRRARSRNPSRSRRRKATSSSCTGAWTVLISGRAGERESGRASLRLLTTRPVTRRS